MLSIRRPVGDAQSDLTADVTRPVDSAGRRNFLRRTGTLASGALATGASLVHAQPLAIPESNTGFGKPIPADDYGVPSKYEAHVRRRRTDVLKNRQNFSDWSMTPLQDQHGIVTPNGLFFERHHAGTPDIDPAKHKLVIHGMVKQPLEFTMEALTRYPSVSRFYFLECSGNGLTDWLKAASTTVQQTHGLLSCAQWTGIPVSWLLDEAGLAPGASWLAFEGADGSGHTRSLPLKKVLDDCLIVYAQNGEMLRPEQGYPVRLLVPGWEGNVSVKWLRRIKVGDRALAFPQRNRALHGPDAGRKVAPVQLRDGMQVGRDASFRRHGDQTGHARDRGLRMVRQRQDSRGRRDRSTAARPGERRGWKSRCSTNV